MLSHINERINISYEFYFSLCDSARNCIRYATKEDFECMFKNLDPNCFHLNYHIYYWSLETNEFSILDPFVQKYLSNHNYIEIKFNEFKKMNEPKYCLYEIHIYKFFYNWRDSVVSWYNDFILKKTFKPLFLYGISDTGKSYFVFRLFGKISI